MSRITKEFNKIPLLSIILMSGWVRFILHFFQLQKIDLASLVLISIIHLYFAIQATTIFTSANILGVSLLLGMVITYQTRSFELLSLIYGLTATVILFSSYFLIAKNDLGNRKKVNTYLAYSFIMILTSLSTIIYKNDLKYLSIIVLVPLAFTIPGIPLSYTLFPNKDLKDYERIIISSVLSVTLTPIFVFYLNKFGLKPGLLSSSISIGLLLLIGVITYLLRTRIQKKTRSIQQ